MKRLLLRLFLGGLLLLLVAAGGLVAFIYSGTYNVAATRQHSAPVYWGLGTALRQSVQAHAVEAPQPPNLADPNLVARGLVLYDRYCIACHGAPGTAPDAIGLGMNPPPPNLVLRARERSARELFWTVSNGLRSTGMPAWEFRTSEDQRWAMVAFLRTMPTLSPSEYRALRARLVRRSDARGRERGPDPVEVRRPSRGDPRRGRIAIRQYACQTCHFIPGVVGAEALVGPPLNGIARRRYLAGVLPNTPDNMIRWLRDPQQVDPLSAMPDVGVTERDARDIAAYLDTLR